MILSSIRLKNIKSYGEGPDGDGITVTFQPGVNCVAGGNGHGKTTLIEAVGYALFLAEPQFEERFKLDTYFLRYGKPAGEIDVTFAHGGNSYRVERGLGAQNKRRSKVVQLSDGSTCALDDAEVSSFLCRLLGAPLPSRLAELFSKLLGVKQGRLTWPFDSKPGAAKEFFEPLLDVAVFRECFSKLGEAQDRFKTLSQEKKVALAGIEERIRERSDSSQKFPVRHQEVAESEKKVAAARQEKEHAEKQQEVHEQKHKHFQDSKAALEAARSNLALATQKREADQQRLVESEEASRVARETFQAHEAFAAAEAKLRQLQEQQGQKSRLQSQREKASVSRTEAEGRARSARDQAAVAAKERQAKQASADELRRQLASGSKELKATETAFKEQVRVTDGARRARDTLGSWRTDLARDIEENRRLLETILEGWKRAGGSQTLSAAQARTEEQALGQAEKEVARELARAEELKKTLAAQLDQIGGGVCPFLKEACRQFNPAKVRSDVGAEEVKIAQLRQRQQEAAEAHARARKQWEQLAREEAGLVELRRSLSDKVTAFVSSHNSLFPERIRGHFEALENCLSTGLGRSGQGELPLGGKAGLKPPLAVSARECWREVDGALEAGRLRELAAAEEVFLAEVASAIETPASELEARLAAFEQQRTDRVRREQDLRNKTQELGRAEAEIQSLSTRIDQQSAEAARAERQLTETTAQIAALDENLKPYANLEADLRTQQNIKDLHAVNQQRHLGARAQADKLDERRGALKASAQLEAEAREQTRSRAEAFDRVAAEFDAAALDRARSVAETARTRLTIELGNLDGARRELERERQRLGELQQAAKDREEIRGQLGRLEAAGALAKLAGTVLRASAPAVAQHLCHRIAAVAQRVFNQINPEPIELEWNAEPHYGLRILPGDRRFAMLSGGEQTKLALAMTLAMIEHFSQLRFLVFDEPTYGVDSESRQRLADAVIEAQRAAGLDQLILVSHDNAFEGKIEHVVVLNKVAGAGTQPAGVK